jgi:phospholipase C
VADEDPDPTQRRFIAGSAAVAGLASIFGTAGCSPSQRNVLQTASQTPPAGASLADVRHIVVLMQENRSFDHYLGTLSGTRGFSDPAAPRHSGRPVFDQAGYRPGVGVDPSGFLQPFRLLSRPPLADGQSTNDIAHDWGIQHRSWNHGAMDSFVTAHIAADGSQNGPVTMGYFSRVDLPFYHALADAFALPAADGQPDAIAGGGPAPPARVVTAGTRPPQASRRRWLERGCTRVNWSNWVRSSLAAAVVALSVM